MTITINNNYLVSLAAERDRLKDIKNEMVRRRDYDGSEKNLKQQQDHSTQPNIAQKDQSFDFNYGQKKKECQNLADKIEISDSPRMKKEGSAQPSDNLFFSPSNWSNRQNASSTPSLRSSHGGCHQSDGIPVKPSFSTCNQGKDSTDSGAVDVLNMSAEAASLQSCSSRGFSVPPPMRSISGRDMSSLNNRLESKS